MSGKSFDYENWHTNEPSNIDGSDGIIIAIGNTGSGGKWFDVPFQGAYYRPLCQLKSWIEIHFISNSNYRFLLKETFEVLFVCLWVM